MAVEAVGCHACAFQRMVESRWLLKVVLLR